MGAHGAHGAALRGENPVPVGKRRPFAPGPRKKRKRDALSSVFLAVNNKITYSKSGVLCFETWNVFLMMATPRLKMIII